MTQSRSVARRIEGEEAAAEVALAKIVKGSKELLSRRASPDRTKLVRRITIQCFTQPAAQHPALNPGLLSQPHCPAFVVRYRRARHHHFITKCIVYSRSPGATGYLFATVSADAHTVSRAARDALCKVFLCCGGDAGSTPPAYQGPPEKLFSARWILQQFQLAFKASKYLDSRQASHVHIRIYVMCRELTARRVAERCGGLQNAPDGDQSRSARGLRHTSCPRHLRLGPMGPVSRWRSTPGRNGFRCRERALHQLHQALQLAADCRVIWSWVMNHLLQRPYATAVLGRTQLALSVR